MNLHVFLLVQTGPSVSADVCKFSSSAYSSMTSILVSDPQPHIFHQAQGIHALIGGVHKAIAA